MAFVRPAPIITYFPIIAYFRDLQLDFAPVSPPSSSGEEEAEEEDADSNESAATSDADNSAANSMDEGSYASTDSADSIGTVFEDVDPDTILPFEKKYWPAPFIAKVDIARYPAPGKLKARCRKKAAAAIREWKKEKGEEADSDSEASGAETAAPSDIKSRSRSSRVGGESSSSSSSTSSSPSSPSSSSSSSASVLDRLYFGNMTGAACPRLREQHGITAIITFFDGDYFHLPKVRPTENPKDAAAALEDGCALHLHVRLRDSRSGDLTEALLALWDWHVWRERHGRYRHVRFLIHCWSGLSRTPAMLLAIVWLELGVRLRGSGGARELAARVRRDLVWVQRTPGYSRADCLEMLGLAKYWRAHLYFMSVICRCRIAKVAGRYQRGFGAWWRLRRGEAVVTRDMAWYRRDVEMISAALRDEDRDDRLRAAAARSAILAWYVREDMAKARTSGLMTGTTGRLEAALRGGWVARFEQWDKGMTGFMRRITAALAAEDEDGQMQVVVDFVGSICDEGGEEGDLAADAIALAAEDADVVAEWLERLERLDRLCERTERLVRRMRWAEVKHAWRDRNRRRREILRLMPLKTPATEDLLWKCQGWL